MQRVEWQIFVELMLTSSIKRPATVFVGGAEWREKNEKKREKSNGMGYMVTENIKLLGRRQRAGRKQSEGKEVG